MYAFPHTFSATHPFLVYFSILKNILYVECYDWPQVACKWYQQLTAITDCQADLVVYLRTDPQTCLARVMGRGRPEEAGLTLSFLQDLHQLHEDWLVRGHFPLYGPTIMLNASVDLPAMLQEYQTLRASMVGGRHLQQLLHLFL